MTLWKRLKNLWILSGLDIEEKQIPIHLLHNLRGKIELEKIKEFTVPPRLATILQDTPETFEDLLDNQEENDNPNK